MVPLLECRDIKLTQLVLKMQEKIKIKSKRYHNLASSQEIVLLQRNGRHGVTVGYVYKFRTRFQKRIVEFY